MPRSFDRDLRRLARLHGLQLAYKDVAGRQRQASADSLRATLGALGVMVQTSDDLTDALAEHRRRDAERIVPPVIVAWNGRPNEIELSIPADRGDDRVLVHVQLENGGEQRTETRLSELPSLASDPAGPEASDSLKVLRLPGSLPPGYHRLTLEAPWGTLDSLLLSAPRQAWPVPAASEFRTWGGFLPLYALRSRRNWGAGNYGDLADLAGWIGESGGRVLGTLPILPAFLDEPCDPSPYAPVTRLAWNEFYIDVAAIPELRECAAARELVESSAVREEIEALRGSDLVEYRRLMALKRRVLEVLSGWFFNTRPSRFAACERFLAENPAIADYAEFRAARDKQQMPWTAWPERMRAGALQPGDFDERVRQYYAFAQWIAAGQLDALSRETSQSGTMLYLDLPLGTRRDGYDAWRHRSEYATGAAAGAPPDAVFTKGQDWGFSPLHPETIRERHYAHVIAYLRHHLRHARMLRMDHVMMLHRLYWIPDGLPASQGVYVRYHAEELYAILALESHRHQALLVGENLGTVPAEVNRALGRHAIRTMHVVQYECESAADGSPAEVPATSVASLNTHDMPTFGGWWSGEDIPVRRELGLLDETGAEDERQNRERQKSSVLRRLRRNGRLPGKTSPGGSGPAPLDVTRACLADLALSPAEVVLVNLEDLWDERRPQNIPGTGEERPNWRRKAAYSLEDLRTSPDVRETLAAIQQLRSGGSLSAASGNP
ncbi:MAG TPA: 4-alpha-glucanotransferase [Planctomycetaceae bacterium]|nr:4-alpha-glucanotransferase [Planctomycetaceae bacterium]